MFISNKRRKMEKNQHEDELALNNYKVLINNVKEDISHLHYYINEFDKNKATLDTVSELNSLSYAFIKQMSCIVENKFCPPSVSLCIRMHMRDFNENLDNALGAFIQVSDMCNIESRIFPDNDYNAMNFEKKAKLIMDHIHHLSCARIILSCLDGNIYYEYMKIKNDYDYITNYYHDLDEVNKHKNDNPRVIEYNVKFISSNKDKKEKVENEHNRNKHK